MGYVNAANVLPQALIEEIQRYIDGEYLYIPRKAENKRSWGEATHARAMLQVRNICVFEDHLSGKSVQELAQENYLSCKTIQRITAQERKRRVPVKGGTGIMDERRIVSIAQQPQLLEYAASWFHAKWGIPKEAYVESMKESLESEAVPCWIVMLEGDEIIGGLGVIENDFHERKDLAPNVCAVYVEEAHRNQGVAGRLLDEISARMTQKGIDTLYLATSHTSFYERYGWTYFCPVMCEGEDTPSRMYRHVAG